MGQDGSGVRRPPPVDNENIPSASKSHLVQCYRLHDTCYERRAFGNRCKLNYAIFHIYTCLASNIMAVLLFSL